MAELRPRILNAQPDETESLPLHDPTQPEPKLFFCFDCQQSFTKNKSLTRHLRTDNHRKQVGLPLEHAHVCSAPGCDQSFNRKGELLRHDREQHQLIPRKRSGEASPGLRRTRTRHALASSSLLSTAVTVPTSDESLFGNRVEPWLGNDIPTASGHAVPLDYDFWSETLRSDQAHERLYQVPDDSIAEEVDHEEPPAYNDLFAILEEDEVGGHISDDPLSTDNRVSNSTTQEIRIDSTTDTLDFMSLDAHESADQDDYDCIDSLSVRPRSSSISLMGSIRRSLPQRSRSSLIKHGANPRSRTQKPLPSCPLCNRRFEHNVDQITQHVAKHIEDLKGEHVCSTCEIGFVHEQDLDWHLKAAESEGHCGYMYEKDHRCSGHHPPRYQDEDDIVPECDRFRLGYLLRTWEHFRLQAFLQRLDEALQCRAEPEMETWSITDYLVYSLERKMSRLSVGRVSAPDSIDYKSRISVRAFGQRLGQGLATRMQVGTEQRRPHKSVRNRSPVDVELYKATLENDTRSMRDFIHMGADVNFIHASPKLITPAAPIEHRDASNPRMAEYEVDSVEKDKFTFGTPLAAAASLGAIEAVQLLLHAGATATIDCRVCERRWLALCQAACRGYVDIAELLIANGASVNLGSSYNRPLWYAAREGHLAVVQVLINRGADVSKGSTDGPPLLVALENDQMAAATMLVDKGANIEDAWTHANNSVLTTVESYGERRKGFHREALITREVLGPMKIKYNLRCLAGTAKETYMRPVGSFTLEENGRYVKTWFQRHSTVLSA